MRLRLYLANLAAIAGFPGLSAAEGLRPQEKVAAPTWRAIGALQPQLSPDGPGPDRSVRGRGERRSAGRRQAHSSAVYVEVAGKPAGSKADAEYFLAWIDRLEAQLKKRDRVPGDAHRKQVDAQLNEAREVYRKIAARE